MARLVQVATGLTALWLLGDAAWTWLRWGYWTTPSALFLATELGAFQWVRSPESWLGLHRVCGATPMWFLCAILSGLASLVIEGRRQI